MTPSVDTSSLQSRELAQLSNVRLGQMLEQAAGALTTRPYLAAMAAEAGRRLSAIGEGKP